MELQKDFGLVDSTEGEEDEELEQEKIAHQVEEGISLRHYQVMLIIFFIYHSHLVKTNCGFFQSDLPLVVSYGAAHHMLINRSNKIFGGIFSQNPQRTLG